MESEISTYPLNSVEKIDYNEDIQEIFLDFKIKNYEKEVYYKYQEQGVNALSWQDSDKSNNTEIDKFLQTSFSRDFVLEIQELGLSDNIYFLHKSLKDYFTKNKDKFDNINKDKKNIDQFITDIILDLFGNIKTKLNKKDIKENTDLFTLFVTTYCVLGKKVNYNKIDKSYTRFFDNLAKTEIIKKLQTQLKSEKKNVDILAKEILELQKQIDNNVLNLKEDADNIQENLLISKQVEDAIQRQKDAILDLKAQREQKEAELKKYKKDSENAIRIKDEISQIDRQIENKEKFLKELEEKKNRLDGFSFDRYNEELDQGEIEKNIKKEQVRYWLKKYGQEKFNEDDIMIAVQKAEQHINDTGESEATSFNKGKKNKYKETLKGIQKNNPDYKVQIPVDYLMSMIFLESHFGTKGLGKRNNAGNVYNDGERTYSFKTPQLGLEACAYNLGTRILAYHKRFGISSYPSDKFPTMKELTENRNKEGKGFVLGIGNQGADNPFRTGTVKVDEEGNAVKGRLNPAGAYMAGYPGGDYVISCYKKIETKNEICLINFEIHKKELDLRKKGLSISERDIINKEIENLKNKKNEYEQTLRKLQDSENKLAPIQMDIEAMGDEQAKLYENMYADLKKANQLNLELQSQGGNMQDEFGYIRKKTDILNDKIDKFRIISDRISVLSAEIQDLSIGQDLLGNEGEFGLGQEDMELVKQQTERTIKGISNEINELQKEISKTNISNESMQEFTKIKQSFNKVKEKIQVKYHEYDVDNGVDLEFLNDNCMIIGDSITEVMHYVGDQKNYAGFKNAYYEAGRKSSEVLQDYKSRIEPKLDRLGENKPKFFVIFCGFNDFDNQTNYGGTYTGANIKEIANDLIKRGITPVISSLYPTKSGRDYTSKNNEIVDVYKKYKEVGNKVIFIDNRNFIINQSKEFKKKFYRRDGLHPTNWGAKQLNAYAQEVIMSLQNP